MKLTKLKLTLLASSAIITTAIVAPVTLVSCSEEKQPNIDVYSAAETIKENFNKEINSDNAVELLSNDNIKQTISRLSIPNDSTPNTQVSKTNSPIVSIDYINNVEFINHSEETDINLILDINIKLNNGQKIKVQNLLTNIINVDSKINKSYFITDPSNSRSITGLSPEGLEQSELYFPSEIWSINFPYKDYAEKQLKNVKKLNFSFSRNLLTLTNGAADSDCMFGRMQKLEYVSFYGCKDLFKNKDDKNKDGLSPQGMFTQCPNLKTIDLRKCTSFKTIYNYFADNCDLLENVYLDGTSINKIGPWIFQNCPKLTSLDFSKVNSNEFINVTDNAFEGAIGMEKIDISNITKLPDLPNNAFYTGNDNTKIIVANQEMQKIVKSALSQHPKAQKNVIIKNS